MRERAAPKTTPFISTLRPTVPHNVAGRTMVIILADVAQLTAAETTDAVHSFVQSYLHWQNRGTVFVKGMSV